MPFTLERIEHLFKNWERQNVYGDKIPNNSNYLIIADYLTGKSNNLNGLSLNYYGRFIIALFDLLENISTPSPNDQLVLSVIQHPDIFSYQKEYWFNYLAKFVERNGDPQSFAAALNFYRQAGLVDKEIYNWLIRIDQLKDIYDVNPLPSKPHFNWLRNFLQNHSYDTLNYQRSWAWDTRVNYNLFKLLEELNPTSAKEYLLKCIFSERSPDLVDFIANYNNGFYVYDLIKEIKNASDSKPQLIARKLEVVLFLKNLDKQHQIQLQREVAAQYLNSILDKGVPLYEDRFRFDHLENRFLGHLPTSATCILILYQEDPTSALERVQVLVNSACALDDKVFVLLHHLLIEDSFPFFVSALKNKEVKADHYLPLVSWIDRLFPMEIYSELFWQLVEHKSKSVRTRVAEILVQRDPESRSKAIRLLQKGKTLARETAALILSNFNDSPLVANAVQLVLNVEANDVTRDLLLQTMKNSLQVNDLNAAREMIHAAKQRGKLDRPIEAWLKEPSLPSLYYINGEQLDSDAIQFLFYRINRVKGIRSEIEANLLLQFIDNNQSEAFALGLIDLLVEHGSKPEHKYLLTLAALTGQDDAVQKIKKLTDHFIENDRSKMAEYGIGALALQGSNKALRIVESYTRKYRNRKVSAGKAALLALETAAEELNISTQELADRIVPDFGFDGLFKIFQVNGKEYRGFIDSKFKIAFFDEDNKKLKAIPEGASEELKEEFKTVAKEVKELIKSQSSRLEYYLVVQHRWSQEQWENFFLKNPVMFIYATKIVWGVYDRQEKLLKTFIVNEEVSLINRFEEEINIPDNSFIGILHPIQVDKDVCQQWQRLIFNYAVEPVFQQLNRSLPDLSGIDMNGRMIKKFDGRLTKEGSIRSTLEKYGWMKGPVGDGGSIDSFHLIYREKNMEAVLEVEGVFAAYGFGEEEQLGNLYFFDRNKITSQYNFIENEDDQRLIPLNDVPVIFMSEAVAAVEVIKIRKVKQEEVIN